MGNLGITDISNIRIGKHITLFVDSANENLAKQTVEKACSNYFVIKLWKV